MKSILIVLPADRWHYGQLSVVEQDAGPLPDVVVFGPFGVDGKADSSTSLAHGNPTRDPAKPFGDTPLGEYVGTIGSEPDTPEHRRSYGKPDAASGKIPVIWLTPVKGDGMSEAWARQVAEGLSVNMGLAIHAGDENGKGGLRPTHGCVRMYQNNMTALVALFSGVQSFRVTIEQKQEPTLTPTGTT